MFDHQLFRLEELAALLPELYKRAKSAWRGEDSSFSHRRLLQVPPQFCAHAEEMFVVPGLDVSGTPDASVCVIHTQHLEEIDSDRMHPVDGVCTTVSLYRRTSPEPIGVLVEAYFGETHQLTLYTD